MLRRRETVSALAALLVALAIAAWWFGSGTEKTASADSCGLIAAYGGIFEVPSLVEVNVSDANRAALLKGVHSCVEAKLTADASARYHAMAERLRGPDTSANEQAERNFVEIELAAAIANTDAIVQQRQVARQLVRGWLVVDEIIKRQGAGAVLVESGASAGASHRDEVAAYQKNCTDAGVPVPGSFATDPAWTFREHLGSDTAIYFVRSDWNDSEVWTYKDAASGGFCVALVRRKADRDEQFVGTICTDSSQQKACFFDNVIYDGASTKRISWEDFQKRSFSDLVHPKDGDFCNLCHLGNNPFIVHPGTALGMVVRSMYAAKVPVSQKFEFLGLGDSPSPWTNFDAIDPQGTGGCFSCHGLPQVTSGSKFCAGVIEMAANRTMPPGYWPAKPTDHAPLWPDNHGCFAEELSPLAKYFPSLVKLKSACTGMAEVACPSQ